MTKERIALKRDYASTGGLSFEIDVTDMSLIEFIELLKEKAKMRGTMQAKGLGINLVIDNGSFYGRIEKGKKK